jgi:hypothetical protein
MTKLDKMTRLLSGEMESGVEQQLRCVIFRRFTKK